MSSVFSNLKPRNTVQKNGFDLSRRSVFSTKCGQILPVFCQATLPDSEYRIDVKQLLRTQPLQTAAFTGFSINYDFFFVPNNYSYTSFNEFISQRQDERHVGQPPYTVLPKFNFRGFMNRLIPCCIFDYIASQYLGVNIGYESEQGTSPDYGFLIGTPNAPWCSVSLEVLRSLDMMGYGNFLPLVKLCAETLWVALDGPGTIVDSYDVFINELLNRTYTLVPSFSGFNDLNSFIFAITTCTNQALLDIGLRGFSTEFPDIHPTLWPFLAYNKAFYEFYRNIYYDDEFGIKFNFRKDGIDIGSLRNYHYVDIFNFDDWTSEFDILSLWELDTSHKFERLLAIMVPKYHLYKKDLFTGVLPSTQFGDVSTMVDDRSWLNLYVKNTGSTSPADIYLNIDRPTLDPNQVSRVGLSNLPTDNPPYAQYSQFRFDPALAISILEQRRADAMQRFKERMLRAGNKVKDVFKAHGWSEPYSANEANPFFIGTFDGRLDINTVAATTQSDEVELGQLGATGTAVVNGSKLRFKSHDFGYIVGVMYIVKEAEYDAYGVEKQHTLTDPFDYPYPELQNISLAPVDVLDLSTYLRFTLNGLNASPILGYLPRFMEYKTAVDKVHGEFFSAPIWPTDMGGTDYNRGYGVFSDWVTPRFDINNFSSVSFLYQSPTCADNVFKVQSNALQSTDQFLVNCYFDVMAVEPISVIGLPI